MQAVQVAGGTVEVASCDWDAVASGDLPRNVELPMGGWIIGADLVYSHRQVGEEGSEGEKGRIAVS